MKQVSIRNIVIPSRSRSGNYPTGSTVAHGGGGSNVAIDLSKYMKLALWLENFESKTDSNGNQYIFAKKSLVSAGGLTAYGSDEANVSSIFEGIPIDNDTIYWDESAGVRILKAKGDRESDFDVTAMWEALSAATDEQINKSHLTDALSEYALQTSLEAVSTKLNDFLEGSDTDNIINKWKELEAFLSGMQETDNLAEILSFKADKSDLSNFVTLSEEQSISGQKTFVKTIYQGTSLANRRAISFVDTSNNAIFADVNGRTIFRGNLLSFQLVNGTDIAKINDTGLFVDNVIESSNSVKSVDLYINGIHLYKENDVLYIEGDLVATGGITAYAQGSRTASTILDGLIIDETTLSKEGGKLSVIGGVGGASNWDELEGKPSWIGDTKPSYVWSEIGEKPSWIGSTKPVYSWSEITDKPTTLGGYGIIDAVTLSTTQYITGEKIFGSTIYQGSSATVRRAVSYVDDSWNCILSDTKGATILRGSIIRFQQVNGTDIATIRDNDFYIKGYNVWHQGNDGSLFKSLRGTLNLSDIDVFVNRSSGTYQVSGTGSSGLLTVFKNIGGSTSALELFTWYDWSRAKIRMTIDSNRYSTWKDLAFLDSNVASATRLQTARTIWGQSFDGQQNVSGSLTGVSNITASGYVNCNNITTASSIVSGGNITINNDIDSTLILGDSYVYLKHQSISDLGGSGLYLYGNVGTRIANRLVVDSDTYLKGNVGIGTITPSVKLHVIGDILSTGGITCYSSDQRAKTVVENINLSLKQIANAPTVRFKWNNWKIKDDGKSHIGGIAQYMQKLLPETVLEANGVLNLDYSTTGYVFAVQTARHLMKYDRELRRLKKRVSYLERQLKKLGYEEVDFISD